MMRVPALAIAVLCALPAWAEDDRRGPDNAYFEGTYEFIGRGPGADGALYAGWAAIEDAGERLSVSRCIGGETETGHLTYEEWGADRLIFLKGELWPGHGATCEFGNDNENYPRLTCYTYPLDDDAIETPGIETYIHARWPKPDHAKGC